MPPSQSTRPRSLGTIKLDDGRAPVLFRFTDRESVALEEVVSGGVIFTRVEEMPLLEDLLEQHRVLSAVLVEQPTLEADEGSVIPESDWRVRARERLNHHLLIREGHDLMEADYAFLAVMSEDDVEQFLHRGLRLLKNPQSSSEDWLSFLEEEAARLGSRLTHESLSPLPETASDDASEPEPLLSLDDLGLVHTRGAFGAPSPLVDRPI